MQGQLKPYWVGRILWLKRKFELEVELLVGQGEVWYVSGWYEGVVQDVCMHLLLHCGEFAGDTGWIWLKALKSGWQNGETKMMKMSRSKAG